MSLKRFLIPFKAIDHDGGIISAGGASYAAAPIHNTEPQSGFGVQSEYQTNFGSGHQLVGHIPIGNGYTVPSTGASYAAPLTGGTFSAPLAVGGGGGGGGGGGYGAPSGNLGYGAPSGNGGYGAPSGSPFLGGGGGGGLSSYVSPSAGGFSAPAVYNGYSGQSGDNAFSFPGGYIAQSNPFINNNGGFSSSGKISYSSQLGSGINYAASSAPSAMGINYAASSSSSTLPQHTDYASGSSSSSSSDYFFPTEYRSANVGDYDDFTQDAPPEQPQAVSQGTYTGK